MFLLSSLIVGPGLLVNLVLKDNWGRPRPVMVGPFGGADPYVEVWKVTDFCARNCSFVSGEVSTAVWLTAIAFVIPRAWRLSVAIIAAVYAGRLAFGGHFIFGRGHFVGDSPCSSSRSEPADIKRGPPATQARAQADAQVNPSGTYVANPLCRIA